MVQVNDIKSNFPCQQPEVALPHQNKNPLKSINSHQALILLPLGMPSKTDDTMIPACY